MLRLSGTINDSIVDGKGIRYSIYTQGCPHNCEGCHNPNTHDFEGGYVEDPNKLLEEIFKNPLLDGVTFSGGEPMCQATILLPIAKACKEKGLNVWVFSGYLFEQLIENEDSKKLLEYTDVLVDGPFILSKRSLDLKFKGSTNQRVIDVQKSLASKNIVLYE